MKTALPWLIIMIWALPLAAEERIVLRTQLQDIPPKQLILPDGSHAGLCWELMQLIEQNCAVRFAYPDELVPLIRVSAELARGDTDIQVGIQKTPEREADMVFGEALYQVKAVAVVRKEDVIDFSSLADLRKLGARQGLILTVWGTGIAQILAAMPGLSVDAEAKSAEIGLRKLMSERGRVFVYHNLSTVYLLDQKEFGQNLRLVDLAWGNDALDAAYQYVAFSKKVKPAVRDLVNATIRKLRQSKQLAGITAKYLK